MITPQSDDQGGENGQTGQFSNAPGELYALANTVASAADDYRQARDDTDTDIANARPGSWPTLVDQWLPVRDQVRRILSTVADNLAHTAVALNQTAERYEQADREAAEPFQRLNPQR